MRKCILHSRYYCPTCKCSAHDATDCRSKECIEWKYYLNNRNNQMTSKPVREGINAPTISPRNTENLLNIEGVTEGESSTDLPIETLKEQLEKVTHHLNENIENLKKDELSSSDARLTQTAIEIGKQSQKDLLEKIQQKENSTLDNNSEKKMSDKEKEKEMMLNPSNLEPEQNSSTKTMDILTIQGNELQITEQTIIEYKKLITTKGELLKNQLPTETSLEIQEEIKKLYGDLEQKEKLKEQQEKIITQTRDTILKEEIQEIGIKLALLSDSTKNKNMSEGNRQEIFEEIQRLETTKELLTQKLSTFNPIIANQFRTSTPIIQDSPMDTEEDRNRKRNASNTEMNRSFSDTDLSQTAKKLKDGSITSFLTFEPQTTKKNKNEEGFTQVINKRKKSYLTKNTINNKQSKIVSSNSNTKSSRNPELKPQQKETQTVPPKKPTNDSKETTAQSNQQTLPSKPSNVSNRSGQQQMKETKKKEEENLNSSDSIKKIWEMFKKDPIDKKLNISSEDFETIINYYLKHQNITSDLTKDKSEQNTVIEEIRKINTSNQEKMEKSLKQMESMITKNTQKLEQKIADINKTVHYIEKTQKTEENKEKASWSSKLKKIEHATQIAAKDEGGFNYNLTTPREIPKLLATDICRKLQETANKTGNTRVRFINILQDHKGVNIQGTSFNKEEVKKNLQSELQKLTESEEINTTEKFQSEVMRISGLRSNVSDEQIYSLLDDNLKDPNFPKEKIKQKVHIFRKVTCYTNKNKMLVYLRVETPILEKLTILGTLYSYSENWGVIHISPIIYVTQCPKCFQYGHGPMKCEHDKVCKRCGSKDHLIKECKQKEKFCFNCKHAKNGKEKDHSCTDRECPIRLEAYTKEEKRCSNQASAQVFKEMMNLQLSWDAQFEENNYG
ncbi:unnamed protein product [Bemisia tabaci]|uniref:CCHC-type domain-containing protein n=1 Tax=Bemisia tabaci TaxID=7038 RepID=A0A9P0A5D3_BEMTA|nr:unnamed protein product [Bemisia tabaci]